MRAVFGLAGVLVVVGVIVWWLGAPGGGLDQTRQTIKTGQAAGEQVRQIAGKDPSTGGRAADSADFDEQTANGKFMGLVATRVDDGGAYQKFFGLKRGDTVVAVMRQGSRIDLRDFDAGMAKAQLEEAYQYSAKIVVVRDGQDLTLPEGQGNAGQKSPLDAIPGVR